MKRMPRLISRHAGLAHIGVTALLAGSVLAGCASTPPAPVTSLDATRTAIVTAERFDDDVPRPAVTMI